MILRVPFAIQTLAMKAITIILKLILAGELSMLWLQSMVFVAVLELLEFAPSLSLEFEF